MAGDYWGEQKYGTGDRVPLRGAGAAPVHSHRRSQWRARLPAAPRTRRPHRCVCGKSWDRTEAAAS